ncbi:MAG: 4-phosphoerythronate dehydrogenase [Gammaproteobacteria bacterium]|nr:MAG: 4-phosphoerythronate dehydrogenase [Gammaproteobacteria bacterium]
MQVIADENIPGVVEAFAQFGEVTCLPGRSITKTDVQDATMLLVRSVTRVNLELLQGTAVKQVYSATIGTDHIDIPWLAGQGISFHHAPGCNAQSAAEYVLSALCVLAKRRGYHLADKRVAIIGCGNVGSRVKRMLDILSVPVLVYDPPLQGEGCELEFIDFDTVFDADIITLHVPLTKTGQYATHHMVDESFFPRMKPDAVLINTSRGAVVNETALIAWLAAHPNANAVLDVWENEPGINRLLLQRVLLGTAHIAGYSLDGKFRATEMLYQAACNQNNEKPQWSSHQFLKEKAAPELVLATGDDEALIRQAVFGCYPIEKDDQLLRAGLKLSDAQWGFHFDQLRRNYRTRREFSVCKATLEDAHQRVSDQLKTLGFEVN